MHCMNLSTCIDSCNHYHNQNIEVSPPLKLLHVTHLQSQFLYTLNSWQSLICSLFLSFCLLEMSYKWNNTVCSLLRLASFTQNNATEIYASHSMFL